MEKKSAELTWDPTWVFMTMLEIGIPFPVLHGIYDRLFKAKVNNSSWSENSIYGRYGGLMVSVWTPD